MVESRWLRWIGPGVVALGAVGFIASTTLGAGVRPWVPSVCAGPATERIATARDQVATAPADLRGKPWFRLDPILDDAGALMASGSSLGSTATGSPGRFPSPQRRSRPARSGASSSSGPMTAPRRASRRSTSRAAAPGPSPMSATSSAARRSTQPARSSTRCGSIAPAAPTSASGDARSMAVPRLARSSARRRPTPASVAPSRPSSPGISRVIGSRSSPVPRSPAASASSHPLAVRP